jgi:hypothetical protein
MMLCGSSSIRSKETVDRECSPSLQQSKSHHPKKRIEEGRKRFVDSSGEDPLTYLELTVRRNNTQKIIITSEIIIHSILF